MKFIRAFLVFCLLFGSDLWAAPSKSKKVANPQSIELNERGANAVKNKDFTQAQEFFRQALQADPGNATAAFNLAGIYLTLKNEPMAVSLLEGYVKEFPQDSGLQVRLGDSYFGTKDVNRALEAYEKGYKLDPKYPGLANKLATIYGLTNDVKKALSMLLAAVDQDPKNGQLLSNLSSVFLANGKTDEAISTAKRALQIRATPELYVTMGSAYESKKDPKNALIAFKRAADLGDPKPELAAKIKELTEKIEG